MSNEMATVKNGRRCRYRVEVYAIRDGKLLACFDGRHPDLPGGGIDAGESIEQAGAREMLEESGYQGTNFRPIFVPGNWVCDVTDDVWLREQNWHEESHRAVVCDAGEFTGSSVFGSEGDASFFTFFEPKRVMEETLAMINKGGLTRRKLMVAQLRLSVLQQLFPERMGANKNIYLEW